MDNSNGIISSGQFLPSSETFVSLYPEKNSKKKWVVILAIILILATAAVIFFIIYFGKSKIGEAHNNGPGDIRLLTTKNDDENYYLVGTDDVLYKIRSVEFDISKNEGINHIPLSCARVAFYARTEDYELCDKDSSKPNEFGSEFFSTLRYALYEAFPVDRFDIRLALKQVYKSNSRVFINVVFITEDDNRDSVLLEYKDLTLTEVVTFKQESILWIDVMAGEQ